MTAPHDPPTTCTWVGCREPAKHPQHAKDGSVSLTCRFPPESAANAFQLVPGQVIEVIAPKDGI